MERLYIDVDMLAEGKAVVNVGKDGGYVMVEYVPSDSKFDKLVLITAVDDIGNVLREFELNLAVTDIEMTTTTEGSAK